MSLPRMYLEEKERKQKDEAAPLTMLAAATAQKS